ncbi:VanW family protein [Salipaludibacillus sp. HK11]|uniref:VanW family protein n=1 Tax=Salipaludibacillus sp. HK11 TaxID=3394320 RepID=UPI0039FCBAEE
MNKWKWFMSSLIIMVGSVIFLSIFTYSGSLVYSILLEEERFESETKIANMDISNLNQEEATLELQNEVENWKESHKVELRWFDKTLTYPMEGLTFLVDESIEDLMISDERNDIFLVQSSQQQLVDMLQVFEFYSDVSNVVFLEGILDDIESEVSTLPNNDVMINVHEYYFEDQLNEDTLSSTTRSFESTLLEAWIDDLSLITIAADSRFSMRESLDEAQIHSLTEKPLSILTSAIYETLLHSNFSLIERVQNDLISDDIPIGFDVKMSPEHGDLVFKNPNPIEYQLQLEYSNNELSVQLVGDPFPYLISVDVKKEDSINPKTIVQYSDELLKGATEVVEYGEEGLNYELVRSMTSPVSDETETELIAEDYYTPVHRVEIHSRDNLVEKSDNIMDSENDEFISGPAKGNDEDQTPTDGSDQSSNSSSDQILSDSEGNFLNDEMNQNTATNDDYNEAETSGTQGENGGDDGEQESIDGSMNNDQAPPVFPKYDEDGHPIKGY